MSAKARGKQPVRSASASYSDQDNAEPTHNGTVDDGGKSGNDDDEVKSGHKVEYHDGDDKAQSRDDNDNDTTDYYHSDDSDTTTERKHRGEATKQNLGFENRKTVNNQYKNNDKA